MSRLNALRWCGALLCLVVATAHAVGDVSVAIMTQPLSACALSDRESVSLRLFNHGDALPAGTRIQLGYGVDDAEPVIESLSLATTLLPDSGLAYRFDQTADLSTPATYTFNAFVRLPGDGNPANDRLGGHQVLHSAPSIGGALRGPQRARTGSLALVGHRGAMVQWERSDDHGEHWKVLHVLEPALEFSVERPAQFRALVKNGACPPAYSDVLEVEPD